MVKLIYVLSKKDIRKLIKSDEGLKTELPWFLISISSTIPRRSVLTDEDRAILGTKGCRDILFEEFGDITDTVYNELKKSYPKAKVPFELFSKKQAKRIISYVKHVNSIKEDCLLIAQCEAGISRSGAVGLFACRYLGLDEYTFRINNSLIEPNPYVYTMLYEISGMRSDCSHD